VHGLEIINLRLFNIIGPRQRGEYGMVVPNFVQQAVRGLPITVYGHGNQTRSFCDVRDVVQMMAQLAGANPFPGEIVNLGNDQEITINQLAELVRQRANSSSTIRHVSHVDGYGEHFDDVTNRRPDLALLKTMIEFNPKWTLTRTIDDLIAKEIDQINSYLSSQVASGS
jgi:nucleoside-diphosphate-sugar epimerase